MLNTLHAVKGGSDFQQGDGTWPIPGVRVIDAYTIEIEFETASPFFLDDLNTIAGQAPIPILPEHVLGGVPEGELFEHDYFASVMTGSGPWKLVQHVPGQLLEVEAFDAFYFGRPGIDKIVIAAVPSLDAVHNAMQRGEIDTSIQGAFGQEGEEVFLQDPRFDVWGHAGAQYRRAGLVQHAQGGRQRPASAQGVGAGDRQGRAVPNLRARAGDEGLDAPRPLLVLQGGVGRSVPARPRGFQEAARRDGLGPRPGAQGDGGPAHERARDCRPRGQAAVPAGRRDQDRDRNLRPGRLGLPGSTSRRTTK